MLIAGADNKRELLGRGEGAKTANPTRDEGPETANLGFIVHLQGAEHFLLTPPKMALEDFS